MTAAIKIASVFVSTTVLAISAPAASQSKFAVIGDYGNAAAADDVANLVKSNNPELVVTVGDNCYGTTPIATQVGANYGEYVNEARFKPSLGNHDYDDACGGGNASGYEAYFTLPNNERYYDFVLGPVHFFAINSNHVEPDGNSATSAQAQWMKQRIQAATEPWKIVYFHHPAYSSGWHGSTTTLQWPFEEWGVDLVLNGHDHDYERVVRDDNKDGSTLTYVVDGMGGEPPKAFETPVAGSVERYNAANGALFVTATDTSLDAEFRDIRGSVPDRFTITKTTAPQHGHGNGHGHVHDHGNGHAATAKQSDR